MAVIPLLGLALVFLNLAARRSGKEDWRETLLSGVLLWAVVLTALTESLSLLGLVTRVGLAVGWSAVCLAAGLALAAGKRLPGRLFSIGERADSFTLSCLIAVAVLSALVAVTSAWAPPNTIDSLTYHMSRVAHWAQNHSVGHYPTAIQRQLYLPPWAEFCLLQFQGLSGGDRWANFVQTGFYLGCVAAASLLAGLLGGGRRSQAASAVAAAALPMAVLQGSSTQNDLVASFWLACLAASVLAARRDGLTPRRLLEMSCASGLALLTKGTAYVLVLPFLAWAFRGEWMRAGAFPASRRFLLAGAVVCAINAGHWGRNMALYGKPVVGTPTTVVNETFHPTAIASNVLRGLLVHAATPIVPLNRLIDSGARALHRAMGRDIDDPRTSWGGTRFELVPFSYDEDVCGNPVHVLALLAAAAILLRRSRRPKEAAAPYLAVVAAQFGLLCLVFKWQPWISRFHLPLFVLLSPVIGLGLFDGSSSWKAWLVVWALWLNALPAGLLNSARPWLGPRSIFSVPRDAQYFAGMPRDLDRAVRLADTVRSSRCADIGLSLASSNSLEYPLWVLLREASGPGLRIEHVGVTNASRGFYSLPRFQGFKPCMVIQEGREAGKVSPEQ